MNQNSPGIVPSVFAPGLVSLKDYYEYGSVFSADGKEFYYAVIIDKKPQIRCIALKNNTWTAPKTVIGSPTYEYNDPFLSPDGKRLYFISDTKAGTMYFSSNGGSTPATDKNYNIRYAKFAKGTFQASQPLPSNVNTEHYEADVFVSPDEDYVIFCAERPAGFGRGDLYISIRHQQLYFENTTGFACFWNRYHGLSKFKQVGCQFNKGCRLGCW